MPTPTLTFDGRTRASLEALSNSYPDSSAVIARIAELSAELVLPKGTIHVVSDVHGEFKKLKHVINNASGGLRPFVDQTFGDRLSQEEKLELLNLIYYPREMFEHLAPRLAGEEERRRFVRDRVRSELELLRRLAGKDSLASFEERVPSTYRPIFREMLLERELSRGPQYVDAYLDQLMREGRELELLRQLAHVIRNLLVSELIVAGDLGDRGPRIDKVIDYLMHQPKVSFTWGNHDAVWMGACLGSAVCMATVVRNSLRYRRLSQLEEGYGIPMSPLEKLARTVYGDDPAERFGVKGDGLRDVLLMQRMQKAAAIIQFKLEGQVIERNPDFDMQSRALLRAIDPKKWTVRIDGKEHPLEDKRFPTIDWSDPLRLSPEEEAAMARLTESFLYSPVMWRQMRFVEKHGAICSVRDHNLIFHGCVPVDAEGRFLDVRMDGAAVRGKALFDALDVVVHRAFREKRPSDLDRLYWLWAGRLSPLFGKDKLTTFERYFVADEATHKETKNPYFKLIHQREFCGRVFEELGVRSDLGVIVNGHVPVKVEAGESPLKQSKMAITIDGAFSEAYGDKGYTLVLDASRTFIAQHHHFDSVKAAVTTGADIIPTIQEVRSYDTPRRVGDTERGDEIRREVELLELLLRAYRESVIIEGGED
jgi:fructose-1,6-bisphosphatase-3